MDESRAKLTVGEWMMPNKDRTAVAAHDSRSERPATFVFHPFDGFLYGQFHVIHGHASFFIGLLFDDVRACFADDRVF